MDATPFTITVTMTITERETRAAVSGYLTDDPHERAMAVDVAGPRRNLGDTTGPFVRPATVNWSAIGSQPPEAAARYAQLLAKAAEVAADLNTQAGL